MGVKEIHLAQSRVSNDYACCSFSYNPISSCHIHWVSIERVWVDRGSDNGELREQCKPCTKSSAKSYLSSEQKSYRDLHAPIKELSIWELLGCLCSYVFEIRKDPEFLQRDYVMIGIRNCGRNASYALRAVL